MFSNPGLQTSSGAGLEYSMKTLQLQFLDSVVDNVNRNIQGDFSIQQYALLHVIVYVAAVMSLKLRTSQDVKYEFKEALKSLLLKADDPQLISISFTATTLTVKARDVEILIPKEGIAGKVGMAVKLYDEALHSLWSLSASKGWEPGPSKCRIRWCGDLSPDFLFTPDPTKYKLQMRAPYQEPSTVSNWVDVLGRGSAQAYTATLAELMAPGSVFALNKSEEKRVDELLAYLLWLDKQATKTQPVITTTTASAFAPDNVRLYRVTGTTVDFKRVGIIKVGAVVTLTTDPPWSSPITFNSRLGNRDTDHKAKRAVKMIGANSSLLVAKAKEVGLQLTEQTLHFSDRLTAELVGLGSHLL